MLLCVANAADAYVVLSNTLQHKIIILKAQNNFFRHVPRGNGRVHT